MSLLRASFRARPRLPPTARARTLHVDNTVNNNFPFKYEKKSTFVAKTVGFIGASFAVPFAAVAFKLSKQ